MKKAIFLTVVGVLSLGAMTMLDSRPRISFDNQADAALLEPMYAPPVESIQTIQLRSGETLSGLLTRASIVGSDLATMLRAVNKHKRARGLEPGTEVTVRRLVGQSAARSMELQFDADTTIRMARGDSGWATTLVLTPTILDTLVAAGLITAGKSLYESVAYDPSLTLPPEDRVPLVYDLAEIYAYRLDFTHDVRPGDRYTLVYEREVRPDGSARHRRILAARIDLGGKRHDAVLFQAHGITGYYDLEGKSMRSGFKLYPVNFKRITSDFSTRRYHPILGIYRAHLGTDFGAARGTPVTVTGDGTVSFAGRDGGYGNVVVVRHAGGYSTRYAHLSRFGGGVRPGKRVRMDDVVGYVGATGLATAPHLHYELRLNGRAINLRKWKRPSAPALPADDRDKYFALVKERLDLLQKVMVDAGLARKTDPVPSVGGGS
jgi:murein DD-endopeptidase MepM/ murein hydrolase activator NlpD